jgi:hypothetical protein
VGLVVALHQLLVVGFDLGEFGLGVALLGCRSLELGGEGCELGFAVLQLLDELAVLFE